MDLKEDSGGLLDSDQSLKIKGIIRERLFNPYNYLPNNIYPSWLHYSTPRRNLTYLKIFVLHNIHYLYWEKD